MKGLLGISRVVDEVSGTVGRWVSWLIVAAAVISAGNALVRKLFDVSSNAWLELQWWLFAAVFLLAAPWALAGNDHIRIDIVSSRLSPSFRNAVEVVGHVLFLLPTAAVILVTSWPYFFTSYSESEQSPNAGGLPLWPIKALIPVAFALLLIQGLSELIKRIAIIRGDLAEPSRHEGYHDVVAATGAGVATTGGDSNTAASPKKP